MLITSLINQFKNTDSLLRNTHWMLVSEGLARASRLVTVIMLAAYLSSTDYGIAILAMVCHELLRVLTRVGSGAKIIQCNDKDLTDYAGNAITLNWIICLGLALLQYSLAATIASFYNSPSLEPLLQLMAATYVIYPIVTVRVYLLQRSNQMKYFGLCSALAVMTDNLSTALLVWLGFGVYAVAIAKILAALVWITGFLMAKVPVIKAAFSKIIMLELLQFSCKVLTSELLKTLRSQLDVLLAGKLLAPEIFGIYSFAKSAGVGLGQSLSNAYLICIYPRIAQLQRDKVLSDGLRPVFLIAFFICLIFLTQSLMAPFYVPLLFNNAWDGAENLVMILCLCAIPALMLDISALILRVRNQINQEVKLQALAVLMLLSFLMINSPASHHEFAIRVVSASVAWLLLLPLFFVKYKKIFFFWRIDPCQ